MQARNDPDRRGLRRRKEISRLRSLFAGLAGQALPAETGAWGLAREALAKQDVEKSGFGFDMSRGCA